eukprot:COSAG06_NODE_14551_length_1147_cov_1.723282_1_plen_87_part_10
MKTAFGRPLLCVAGSNLYRNGSFIHPRQTRDTHRESTHLKKHTVYFWINLFLDAGTDSARGRGRARQGPRGAAAADPRSKKRSFLYY